MVLNAQGSLDDVVERAERVERAEKISPPQPAKAIVPQVPIESGGLVPSPSDGHRPCWLPHKATGDQKSKATATIVTHEDDPLEPGSLSSREQVVGGGTKICGVARASPYLLRVGICRTNLLFRL